MTYSFAMAGQITDPEKEKSLLADLKAICRKYGEGLAYAHWKGAQTGEEILKG